jgi:hypothetical protein
LHCIATFLSAVPTLHIPASSMTNVVKTLIPPETIVTIQATPRRLKPRQHDESFKLMERRLVMIKTFHPAATEHDLG